MTELIALSLQGKAPRTTVRVVRKTGADATRWYELIDTSFYQMVGETFEEVQDGPVSV